MTRLPRTDLLAFLAICLAGCAASPIVDGDGSDESEAHSGFESTPNTAPEPSDDEPGVDSNADLSDRPSLGTTSAALKPDAGAGSAPDAGGAPRDAGVKGSDVKDAGASDPGSEDAGVKDAGVKDAGARDAGPPDAGTTTEPTPARDAGLSTTKPAAGMCRAASDCPESCVPIGIFPCCRANGTCGCTWALGAYCR
jgi:hypothetical protein